MPQKFLLAKQSLYLVKVSNGFKVLSKDIKAFKFQEDLAYEQISLKEYIDPFTGEPVKKGK